MQKEKRLIYTSMGSYVKGGLERAKSKKSKKKSSHNKSNQLIDTAAKVYLTNPKLLPRNEIKSLIKTSRNNHDKSSFLLRKLAEELERREVEGSFFRRNKQKEKNNNDVSLKAVPFEADFKSEHIRPTTCSQKKRYKNISISKQSIKQITDEQVAVLDEERARKRQLIVPRLRESLRDIYSVKRSLPSPSNNESVKLVSSTRNQIVSTSIQSKNFPCTPKNKRLNSQTSQDSMRSSISEIKKQNPITARNIKGYIINERQEMVSQFLSVMGWKALNLLSERFTLKWTYNESYKDYETVRLRNKGEKNNKAYYNHIKNNNLVKKDQFHKLMMEIGSKNIKVNNFIPKTFLLPLEKQEFLLEYNQRILMILVQKHFHYFSTFSLNVHENFSMEEVIEEVVKIGQSGENQNLIGSFVDQSELGESEPLIAQISLLFYIIVLACNLWICQEGYDSQQFDRIYSKVCEDQTIKAMLITCCKVQIPFEQYKSSPSRRKSGKEEAVSVKNGYIRTTTTFLKPSKRLVVIIFKLHEYFLRKFEDYEIGGRLNLWIAKPCSGSKGCGIQIFDKAQKINNLLDTSTTHNKIIQKYIENVWILTPQMVCGNPQLQKHHLVGKKFDIRQWVLMTQSQSYIFSHFYVKICSKNYDINFSNDHHMHLANYTVNRDNFNATDSANSVCSSDELASIFDKIRMKSKFEQMKKTLRDNLLTIVDEAMEESESIEGTFEIVGFDIVIDQNLKPWIIECNMSPACDTRTPWLRQMKRSMTAGALQIVLENQSLSSLYNEQYRWEKLGAPSVCKKTGRDSQAGERLEIVGSKINKKKSMTKKFRKQTLKTKFNSKELA